jgi:hypothetical protein
MPLLSSGIKREWYMYVKHKYEGGHTGVTSIVSAQYVPICGPIWKLYLITVALVVKSPFFHRSEPAMAAIS